MNGYRCDASGLTRCNDLDEYRVVDWDLVMPMPGKVHVLRYIGPIPGFMITILSPDVEYVNPAHEILCTGNWATCFPVFKFACALEGSI